MGLALLPHVGLAQSHQNSRSRWFVSEALELMGDWKERGDCSAIQIQTAGQWQQTTSLPSKAALKGTNDPTNRFHFKNLCLCEVSLQNSLEGIKNPRTFKNTASAILPCQFSKDVYKIPNKSTFATVSNDHAGVH